nr:serine hydrolase [Kofleriaceae bacterium]
PQTPGTSWAYSNFGFMLLSTVATHASGGTLEALLQQTLFQPLGMNHAYIRQMPTATVAAKGHTPGGREVPAWEFTDAMAGVGGVRASLDDMARYAAALLGRGDAGVVANLVQATTPLLTPVDGPAMAVGWPVLTVGANTIIAHNGGTGGFSSFIAVDKTRQRAVVVLADTSMASFGYINELALHLLDPALAAAPTPRLAATPPATLLQQLVGRYRIDALDVELALEARNGTLYVVLPGSPDTALSYDNHGDFYPSDVDALITPVRQPDGSYNLQYTADGSFEAQRLP